MLSEVSVEKTETEIEPKMIQEKHKITISAPDVCRFCLAAAKYHHLKNIFENDDLPLEIFEAFNISVYKTDAMPPKICEYCLGNLRYIKTLKDTMLKSYNQFNFYVKSAQHFQNKGVTLTKWPAQQKCQTISEPMSEPISNYKEYSNENHEIFSNDLKTLFPQFFIVHAVKEEEELILKEDVSPVKKKKKTRSKRTLILSKDAVDDTIPIINASFVKSDTEMWDGDDTHNDSSESDTDPESPERKISFPKIKHKFNRKNVECDMCGKKISYYQILNHLNGHIGVKPYKCSISGCNKEFTRKAGRTHHINKVHSKIKAPPVQCFQCGKFLSRPSMLLKHLQVHSGERPYQCDLCKSKFQTSYNLTVHMRVHTKEKKFVCKICGTAFGYNSILKQHTEKQHPGSK